MAMGREKVALAKTIIGYCGGVKDPSALGGTYVCEWGFELYHEGGSIAVKPRNMVTINNDTITIKETTGEFSPEEGSGLKGFLWEMANSALKHFAAPEHTILWSKVIRVGG